MGGSQQHATQAGLKKVIYSCEAATKQKFVPNCFLTSSEPDTRYDSYICSES